MVRFRRINWLKWGALLVGAGLVLLNGWIDRLERFVANPPTTDAGWETYESFVKEIINTVYSVIGGESESHE